MKFPTQLLLSAILALGLAGPAAAQQTYQIDREGQHAFVNAKWLHLGFSVLWATFEDFRGTFEYDPDDITNSSVSVTIDVASIDTNHAERDRHLRSADYLDVEQYPEARFESTRIEDEGDGNFTIYGDFTLRGQTEEIAIDASLTGKGDDPWGGYRAGFEGYTTIDVSNYGMDFPKSNEVDLELFVEGVRQ